MEDCLRGGGGHLGPSCTAAVGEADLGGEELSTEEPLLA